MSGPLQLSVFDIDGTLVDSQREIVAAMRAAFESCALRAPEPARILSIVGLSLPQAIAQLAPDLSEAAQTRLVHGYKQHFAQDRARSAPPPLYPGVRALLNVLAQQPEMLLGVATGKSRRGLAALLSAHDLAPRFTTTQVADDHPSKPHPAMLTTALSETGVPATMGVMIGDTSFDIEMARAAGLRGIGVAWGYHGTQRLTEAGADVVVPDIDALADELLSRKRVTS